MAEITDPEITDLGGRDDTMVPALQNVDNYFEAKQPLENGLENVLKTTGADKLISDIKSISEDTAFLLAYQWDTQLAKTTLETFTTAFEEANKLKTGESTAPEIVGNVEKLFDVLRRQFPQDRLNTFQDLLNNIDNS